MTDLIRRADALALIERKIGKDHPALGVELHHAIAALPAVTVEPVAYRVRVAGDDPEEWQPLTVARALDFVDRKGYECQPLYVTPTVTVGVKPLVWHDKPEGQDCRIGRCEHIAYAVERRGNFWGFRRSGDTGLIVAVGAGKAFSTEAEAMAGADRDHVKRILAALEPVAAPDPAAIREAAQSLLDLHDGFLAGRDVDEDAARRLHVASSFGAAAFLSCPVGGGEALAMTRAFLLALINPLHPDLDYLRAGKRISEAKGAAE